MKYLSSVIVIAATLAACTSELKAKFDTPCGKTMVNDGHFKHAQEHCNKEKCDNISQHYWSTKHLPLGIWMPLLTDVEKEGDRMTLRVSTLATEVLDKNNYDMVISAEKDSNGNWGNFKCIKEH